MGHRVLSRSYIKKWWPSNRGGLALFAEPRAGRESGGAPAAGPSRAGYLGLGDLGSEIWDPGLIQAADDPDPRIRGLGSRGSEDWDELRSGIRWDLGIPWDPGIQGSGDGIRGGLVGIRGRDRDLGIRGLGSGDPGTIWELAQRPDPRYIRQI